MHPNYLFMPTFVGAAILCVAGVRVSRAEWSRSSRVAWIALAAVLALPALLFVAYYLHVLDRAAWFYTLRAARYTELTAAGLGFSVGLIIGHLYHPGSAQRSPLRVPLTAVVILCCIVLLGVPYVKPIMAPIRVPLHDKWADGICLQSTPSTCGPCSAVTLLRLFHVSSSEHKLADECFSYAGGTENWYVARALRRRGLETEYLIGSPQPDILPFPSIAGVQFGSLHVGGHFIAIMGHTRDRYIVGDPLKGKLTLTANQLRARYYFTGFFLIVHDPTGRPPALPA